LTSVSSGHAEAAAILAALLIWAPRFSRCTVLVRSDSLVVVQAWASQSSASPAIDAYIRAFAHVCSLWSATLVIEHLPGVDNNIADAISRSQVAKFRQLLPAAQQWPSPAPSLEAIWLSWHT
jgi:hypothetical protein